MALLISSFTALWLGIVTSVSPCPLATNVAAISMLSRKVGNQRYAVLGALAYTLGRMIVYLALALILLGGLSSMPGLSAFLRNGIGPFIGPLLILTGMAIVGWLPLPFELKLGSAATTERLSRWGLLGEFMIGAIFALSFCPVSAALFFGSLIPLSLESSLPPVPVLLYGLGTSLPVGIIALVIVFSTRKASALLGGLQAVQKKLLWVTAALLIGIGVWLTLASLLTG
ncbi:aromatic aminobenezylarsenical efflux permease ArsG family transporter [Coraliomargarita sp. SDUM461004]|uniref:Aromatic aminobenezylarsenical efflux permease ArsG family transporter n=1 Tax=Thalassobacterium sedimentorum TaxID=3041258 RepID=A0ABU1ALD9_9BACT|nr:aromatic aminobenezylarsenical efflux permease ArsG family transporter [Coraliomargarita sp. SDUM461004]MDQ8195018.1 aromatic aminobenezylarsenical efflux permease ArsG family transporter [Coraliomargarita sp. SDUM461004]